MRDRELPRIPYDHLSVMTDDGVSLAVQVAGHGPPVLLANGIGVNTPGLDFLAEHLLPRHRVICWDYRGTGGSPVDDPATDLSVPRHARDALAILDALDVPQAAVLGWSMGVPVALEMIRRAPDRVTALGALFGAAGTPFRLAFPGLISDSVHGVVHLAANVPGLGQAVLEAAVALPGVAWAVCSGLGFVGRHAHPRVFARNVDSVRRAQKPQYFQTLRELIYHDAHDVLPGIRCPVLVVAGGRDWVTPPHAAEAMVRALPAAEYVLLPDASHFGIIEHGPALYGPVDRLLLDPGAPPPPEVRP